MNDKSKEADFRLLAEVTKIKEMIEERYALTRLSIGDEVRVIHTNPNDGSDESFIGIIQAVQDFTGAYQVDGDFYHSNQVMKIKADRIKTKKPKYFQPIGYFKPDEAPLLCYSLVEKKSE